MKKPVISLEEVRQRIRAAGLRSTSARIAVYQVLLEATAPLSHAEVADGLEPRGFDKATVYRNLVDLADAGVAARRDLGDHVWRFELLAEDAQQHTHPHFMCDTCGEVTCLPEVEVHIKPTKGRKRPAMGQISEILLKGTCDRCV